MRVGSTRHALVKMNALQRYVFPVRTGVSAVHLSMKKPTNCPFCGAAPESTHDPMCGLYQANQIERKYPMKIVPFCSPPPSPPKRSFLSEMDVLCGKVFFNIDDPHRYFIKTSNGGCVDLSYGTYFPKEKMSSSREAVILYDAELVLNLPTWLIQA